MDIVISGQHIPITTSLHDYAQSKVEEIIHKYFDKVTRVLVHFREDGHKHYNHYVCNIIIHNDLGKHAIIKSDAVSDELFMSFDLATACLEKQLRKYKSKLKEHRPHDIQMRQAVKYVITPSLEDHDDKSLLVNGHKIITETTLEISVLSLDEAVAKMDLENSRVLIFENNSSHKINAIYYRPDGDIAWIECK